MCIEDRMLPQEYQDFLRKMDEDSSLKEAVSLQGLVAEAINHSTEETAQK